MIINKLNNKVICPKFRALSEDKATNETEPTQHAKAGFLDKFETSIRNSADLNDTIKVPRTIFKGYLAFMASTTLVTLASFAKTKYPKSATVMNTISAGLALWGTYSFVRPYIIKTPQQTEA